MKHKPSIIVDKCMRPVAVGAPQFHFLGWQDSGTEGGLRSRANTCSSSSSSSGGQAGVGVITEARRHFARRYWWCWADLGQSSCCWCRYGRVVRFVVLKCWRFNAVGRTELVVFVCTSYLSLLPIPRAQLTPAAPPSSSCTSRPSY